MGRLAVVHVDVFTSSIRLLSGETFLQSATVYDLELGHRSDYTSSCISCQPLEILFSVLERIACFS